MHTTLLIMAAGLGSRYGGNKQIDAMGPGGEILMEYSIYDAMRAGFDKVVFVIKRAMETSFRAQVGDRIAQKVAVDYAFQEFDTLPEGFTVPEGRQKPYGTVHAVLCAAPYIDGPFAVINADDYYGQDAFAAMARSLKGMAGQDCVASMVAYYLRNTVSENGDVTRGVCERDENGHLVSITETYKIRPCADGTIRDLSEGEGTILDPDALVSMNIWGFTPWLFTVGEKAMKDFLAGLAEGELKREFPLPILVDDLMREYGLKVEVLSTDAVWFGVTVREDKPQVMGELKKLHDAGVYPAKMF